jgi:hypothetical protein
LIQKFFYSRGRLAAWELAPGLFVISTMTNQPCWIRDGENRLEAAGVKHGDISVLASNADEWYKEGKPSTFPDRDLDRKDDRAEAAGTGAGVGAVAGGTLGALTGLGLLAIPGVGPVVAAGWLVATLDGSRRRQRDRRCARCAHSGGRRQGRGG